MDGNTEQIRLITSQMADAMYGRQEGIDAKLDNLKLNLEQQIEVKIDAAVTKMKFWVVSAVLTQIVAMLPVIFFLGGIYSTNSSALQSIQKVQQTIDQRSNWMSERVQWEQSVEQWAQPKGYTPPRYRDSAR